jgi:hypothetical protein
MSEFESCSLLVSWIGVFTTLIIIILAIWGEKIRQIWTKPKLEIFLDTPNFNVTKSGARGWYYLVRVTNKKISCPANNVRLLLIQMFKRGVDGDWREENFSGPVEVMWQNPSLNPNNVTIGPPQRATISSLVEGRDEFFFSLYWSPNNLKTTISASEPTRLVFQARSDTAQSNLITVEINWDGEWNEGRLKMQNHCIIRKV